MTSSVARWVDGLELARRRRRRLAGFAVLGATLLVAGTPGAGFATTSPGQHVDAVVLIQSGGITVGYEARLPRGVNVTFFVKNLTKSPKNFEFLGKKTTRIQPGKQAKLTLTLERRGEFPYLSTLNPSKQLRGIFVVY